MKSLLNSHDNQEILSRLDKLTPESRPLWGKMTAAQMVAHSERPLQVMLGEMKLKRGLMGMLFGKMAKKELVKETPFKHSLPTSNSFLVKQDVNFEVEKNKLIQLIKKVNEGPSVITKDPHPFFGKLTVDEWGLIQWKHLDHHLRQFGV